MRKVHRYLGLLLSVIVILVSLTGSALVWKREYLWLSIPQARELPNRSNEQIANVANNIESAYPAGEVSFIQLYSENLAIHKVFLSERRYAWHDQAGKQIQVWEGNERFEDWLLDLHRRFLLGDKVGLNIAGFGGILLLILTLLGLKVWWPWRRSWRFTVLPSSTRHGDLRRGHFSLGVFLALPILIVGITGVILVYPVESRAVLLPHQAEIQMRINEVPRQVNEVWSWDHALDYAAQQFPQSTVKWLSRNADQKLSIGVQERGVTNRMGESSVSFNTGNQVTVKSHKAQTVSHQLMQFTYPLHTGKLPTWYRLLLSCFGVLLAWLAWVGVWSRLKRS